MRLFSGAKVFVFPSFAEGFGLPPLEAMASGVPVVCSDIPVFREVYGDAVFYVDPNRPSRSRKGCGSSERMSGLSARFARTWPGRAELYRREPFVKRLPRSDQINVKCGIGTMNFPPDSRYAFSRSRNSSRKCHGSTRK